MSLYTYEKRKAFLDDLDDPRHGTSTGRCIAYCTCPKCAAFRAEYNARKREEYRERRAAKKTIKRNAERLIKHDEVCTVDELLKPMMGRPSIKAPYCVVCGSTENLEQHHPVKRSEGKWIRNGREVQKPTLTLCRDCHSKVHSKGTLFFRWTKAYDESSFNVNCTKAHVGAGRWEFLEVSDKKDREWKESHPLPNGKLPSRIGYANALQMKGWKRIR